MPGMPEPVAPSPQFSLGPGDRGFPPATGYHHCKGILRGLSGSCGISLLAADYMISSVFDDKTFDQKSEKDYKDNGIIAVPFLCMSFSRQLTNFIILGVNGRYRYQRDSAFFGGQHIPYHSFTSRPSNVFDDVPFGYKLGGIELSMYVLFTLRLREVKE
jgi:hypothetical protein